MDKEAWVAVLLIPLVTAPVWLHLLAYSLSKRYRDFVRDHEGIM